MLSDMLNFVRRNGEVSVKFRVFRQIHIFYEYQLRTFCRNFRIFLRLRFCLKCLSSLCFGLRFEKKVTNLQNRTKGCTNGLHSWVTGTLFWRSDSVAKNLWPEETDMRAVLFSLCCLWESMNIFSAFFLLLFRTNENTQKSKYCCLFIFYKDLTRSGIILKNKNVFCVFNQ